MEPRSSVCQDGGVTGIRRQRPARRPDALTKDLIVRSAITLLDHGGTEALSFRALAAALATGSGALYHHVANKGELLAAAATATMTEVVGRAADADPGGSIRAVAMDVFDEIVARPWWGTQLVAAPWQPAVLHLFDRVGSDLTAVGVRQEFQFDAASALVHHVLGVASQYDAGRRLTGDKRSRPAFLQSSTSAVTGDDTGRFPFLARIGQRLVEHDDRAQFQAGIEIILAGIDALHGPHRQDGQDSSGPTRS